MFQIGGLIVFCGLLAQTMAQADAPAPPSDASQSSTGLFGTLTKALGSGLTSGSLLGSLQSIPLSNILNPKGGLAGGLLGPLSPILNIISLKFTGTKLLEFGIVPSSDGHRLYTTIPVSMNFTINLPLAGNLAEGTVIQNVTAEIQPEKDAQGNAHLVVGNCASSPGTVNITVLHGNFPSINNIVNNVKSFATTVLPGLVQTQVCPAINKILSNLDVTVANNIANQLAKGLDVVVSF